MLFIFKELLRSLINLIHALKSGESPIDGV